MSVIPKAAHPLEYVAFLTVQIRTGEGDAYVYLAVDAYLDYVFNLGVEMDKEPETVLKTIYFLLEDPEFTKHMTDHGFTLVMEEFQELAPRLKAVVEPAGGKVLFNKTYNNVISNPVLQSLHEHLSGRG